jgi:hypothetical protein
MTMIAYAFLQHRRLKTARREKKSQRAAASTDIARRAPSHRSKLRAAVDRVKAFLPRGRGSSS